MSTFNGKPFKFKTPEKTFVDAFFSAELSLFASVSLTCFFLFLLGFLDYVTGKDVSFTLLYIFPVFLATWFGNRTLGLVASGLSVLTSLVADHFDGVHYSSAAVAVWAGFSRLAIFAVVSLLISAVKRLWLNERTLAATDILTGLPNRRWFLKTLEQELHRHQRMNAPFALAMLDLDNFKAVNDGLGHAEGDKLLIQVGKTLEKNLRGTDLAARLGGDEFAVLFPMVAHEGAQALAQRLFQSILQTLQTHAWPVTVSLGMVTCLGLQTGSDALLQEADRLLYKAKNGGKNRIECAVVKARETDGPSFIGL